jgi:hypothetical protein
VNVAFFGLAEIEDAASTLAVNENSKRKKRSGVTSRDITACADAATELRTRKLLTLGVKSIKNE